MHACMHACVRAAGGALMAEGMPSSSFKGVIPASQPKPYCQHGLGCLGRLSIVGGHEHGEIREVM